MQFDIRTDGSDGVNSMFWSHAAAMLSMSNWRNSKHSPFCAFSLYEIAIVDLGGTPLATTSGYDMISERSGDVRQWCMPWERVEWAQSKRSWELASGNNFTGPNAVKLGAFPYKTSEFSISLIFVYSFLPLNLPLQCISIYCESTINDSGTKSV